MTPLIFADPLLMPQNCEFAPIKDYLAKAAPRAEKSPQYLRVGGTGLNKPPAVTFGVGFLPPVPLQSSRYLSTAVIQQLPSLGVVQSGSSQS
jgi:hypothetical protein